MDAASEKKRLRAAVLARLKARPGAQRAADSAALRALLLPILEEMTQALARPLGIALYAPLPHEVNLMPLLHEHPQHRYAFPRCRPGRQLSFHLVSSPEIDLQPGAMGILAPREELPCLAPGDIDLLLVPGVAFTAAGERLGYGGGYYDTYIPRCPNARLLALAFREQILAALPCEAHDVRVELIVKN